MRDEGGGMKGKEEGGRMKVEVKRIMSFLLLTCAFCLGVAQAQGFPARPISMIVPYAAGGSADVVGRLVAAEMSKTLGQNVVLELIHELGLELQVSFNKGAVMVLPSGVNKKSGLLAALDELGISPHNVVSVGDAENDHELLRVAEVGVAAEWGGRAQQAAADVVLEGSGPEAVAAFVTLLGSTGGFQSHCGYDVACCSGTWKTPASVRIGAAKTSPPTAQPDTSSFRCGSYCVVICASNSSGREHRRAAGGESRYRLRHAGISEATLSAWRDARRRDARTARRLRSGLPANLRRVVRLKGGVYFFLNFARIRF